jgi:uncharacterized protein YbjT (DUF2867 family)
MNKIVNVTGATGLVGRELVKQLLLETDIKSIKIFFRRKSGFEHPKLEEHIIDFDKPAAWKHLVAGDVLYSTLGTTLKQAGSKPAQYKVDYTYQYQFAQAAAENGVPTFVMVSSAGANASSSIFYSKMKGELDEAVQKLSFTHCVILRPSILVGERENKRAAEEFANKIMKLISRFIFKKYRPIEGKIVARAMINTSIHQPKPGVLIAELDEIFGLAEK